jgi:hypothetical protein
VGGQYKADLREMRRGGVNRIGLVADNYQWRALVDMVIKFRVAKHFWKVLE